MTERRFCVKCLVEKDISRFVLRRDTGKHRNMCRECQYSQKSAREVRVKSDNPIRFAELQEVKRLKRKAYKQHNLERIRARDKKYREENQQKVLAASRKYKEDNRELHNQRNREYSKTPSGAASNRNKLAKYRAKNNKQLLTLTTLKKSLKYTLLQLDWNCG